MVLDKMYPFLQTVTAGDIATVRKLAKPPHLIMRIMDCCLLLFQKRLDTVRIDPERQCIQPSWAEALKVTKHICIQFQWDSAPSTQNQHTVSPFCGPISRDMTVVCVLVPVYIFCCLDNNNSNNNNQHYKVTNGSLLPNFPYPLLSLLVALVL